MKYIYPFILIIFASNPCVMGQHLRFDTDEGTSPDVPKAFVYDPQTGKSTANKGSLYRKKGQNGAWKSLDGMIISKATEGFTLEGFVKPDGEPKQTAWAILKTRKSDDYSELGIGVNFLRQFNQTYFFGTYTPAKSQPREWGLGHFVTIARLTPAVSWRHLAIVYDAKRLRVDAYLDYWLTSSQKLEKPLSFDDAPVLIGGRENQGWAGHIDEVRVTPKPLTPGQFLRATPVEINNINFDSPEAIWPRDSGYIDVRSGFGAVGDGQHDDTAAIQKAFDECADKIPAAYYTLYLPPGKYLVSKTLRCSRFILIRGAGPDKTIIQLRDNAPDFSDPKKPVTVLRTSSTGGPPGSNSAVNGSSIGIYVRGLAIDTGKGNPGATGLEYHSNNHGTLEDVVIRSGDGAGLIGLDLTHKTNGPALIKRVRIEGFDIGIATAYMEYSLTFEHLNLSNQRVVGIRNQGNILAIRKLTSANRVTAIETGNEVAMLTLIDSELRGGEGTAIKAEGGVFLRNVRVSDYPISLAKGTEQIKGNIDEFVSQHIVTNNNAQPKSLNLPIEETPESASIPLSEWVNVRSFAKVNSNDDWGPIVQAAIDSGAKVIYFPNGGYSVKTPIRLRGKVERLVGMKSALRRVAGSSGPTLIFDEPTKERIVTIEMMDITELHHNSPSTLVLKSSTPGHYRNAPGCGKLFCEDVEGTHWHFDHPQKVWVRQWNPESHEAGPCIESRGATIWSLGFKTEYESSKLWASNGAKTEILGAFIYPVVRGIPKDRPIFKNVDSDMSVTYGLSVYVANHDLHIQDVHNGIIREFRTKDSRQVGPRFRMDLFSTRRSDSK